MSRQLSLYDHIFIDEFAGGGGASTGIELATGHPVDIAINHDEGAILMHKKNHPFTEHYQENVWAVNPLTATRGRHVRLAWFSPDCKHFSRAKGRALVDKKIRGLAWIVLRWAGIVRPDVIMLENVPEFTTWGPVRKGKPIKKKAGQTYRKWYNQLSELGYVIESRILCAADYGAPTIRKRFCLVARCDGKPIVFPKRTHAPRDSEEVRNGKLKPWRTAAEIIDWTIPCYSIFESKEKIKNEYGVRVNRPLKPNSLRRIARGLDKFVLRSAEPFIIPIGYGERPGQAPRTNDIKSPLSTVVSSTKQYLCTPILTQYHTEKNGDRARGQNINSPLMTVDGSNRYGLAAMHLTQYFSGDGHYHTVEEPLATITTMEREGVIAAFLSEYYGNAREGIDIKRPMQTITSKDREGIVIVKLINKDCCCSTGHWNEVRLLLNEYTDYHIANNEILLLIINGVKYFISDIGFRMLTPRELYDAMGFPHDYVIDTDVNGNTITRTKQVEKCGNAVCPPVAEALVRANLPEECSVTVRYDTMRDLHRAMVC